MPHTPQEIRPYDSRDVLTIIVVLGVFRGLPLNSVFQISPTFFSSFHPPFQIVPGPWELLFFSPLKIWTLIQTNHPPSVVQGRWPSLTTQSPGIKIRSTADEANSRTKSGWVLQKNGDSLGARFLEDTSRKKMTGGEDSFGGNKRDIYVLPMKVRVH